MKIKAILFALCLGLLGPTEAQAVFDTGTGPYNSVSAAVRQPDGKIVIGGGFTSVDGFPRNGIARLNADGTLDLSFNPGIAANLGSTVRSIVLQPDGKIIAAGDFIFVGETDLTAVNPPAVFRGLIRLNPDGSLDPTLNPGLGPYLNNSIVVSDPPLVQQIALQPDGKIIVVGSFNTYQFSSAFGICRIFPDGSLDQSFSDAVGRGSQPFVRPSEEVPKVWTVRVQSDGKILVGGEFAIWGDRARRCIVRLNSNGSTDDTFNPELGATNNQPSSEPGETGGASVKAMAVDSQGRIYLAGSFINFNGVPRRSVVRVSSTGAIDLSYNAGALSTVGVDGGISDLALQSDGRVYLVGDLTRVNGVARAGIARLGTDGRIDSTFNPGLGFSGGTASVIFQQPDGFVVVGGSFTNYNGTAITAIARINQTGGLDGSTSGDGSGAVSGNFDFSYKSSPGTNGQINALLLQPDGKYVLAGQFTTYNSASAIRVARTTSEGAVDADNPSTPATEGFTVGSGPNGFAFALGRQSDGKILVGGSFTQFNGLTTGGIARVQVDGTVDTSFVAGLDGTVLSIALQSDGKILIGGTFTRAGGTSRSGVARLNADGSLDSSFNPGSGAGGSVKAVALQGDGKVLVAGAFSDFAGQAAGRIVRLNANGSIDTTFQAGAGADNTIEALALQSDGKILAVGNFAQFNRASRNRVVRLNSNGSVDAGFNNPLGGPSGVVKCVIVERSGKIFIGGQYASFNGNNNGFNPARLLSDGTLDNSFVPPSNDNVLINAMVLQPNDRLVVAGSFVASLNSNEFNNIVRIQNTVEDGRLVNVSSRAKVESGANVVIGGFVVNGETHKRILVRAIGPTLGAYGVSDALSTPTLELYDDQGRLLTANTGWATNPFKSDIVVTGLAPQNPSDSALIVTLRPGAYTAKVAGASGNVGVALVEVYDLDTRAAPRMINISTRAKVQQGDNVLIGGFAVRAESRRVVVRATGPSLSAYGVPGVLAQPTLTIVDANGTVIATNEGWRTGSNAAALQATGFAPADDREPGLLLDLPVGTYTAIVRGAGGTSGVALVEVFDTN
ncbi:MAG: delta-60 repeat domain-containing protein [Verrucomicrobia bacterium]|nr:delta-60 repeat domain-containing protein [Verrucomicrobiota bacterium]